MTSGLNGTRVALIVLSVLLVVGIVPLIYYSITRKIHDVRRYDFTGKGNGHDAPVFSGKLKVMSYNIAHGRGNDSFIDKNEFRKVFSIASRAELLANLDRVAEVILKEDPDVIGLNEVDLETTSTFDVDFVEYLAEKTGYRYPFAAYGIKWRFRLPFYRHNTGNAIFSKYPLENPENVTVGSEGIKAFFVGTHTALSADLLLGPASIKIYATHLYSPMEDPKNSSVRKSQVARLLEHAAAHPAVVLTGDFNSVLKSQREVSLHIQKFYPDEDALDQVAEAGRYRVFDPGEDPLADRYLTSKTLEPAKTIDYIFPDTSLAIESYYAGRYDASDHRPVIAVLLVGGQ